jgi:N-acetyl-gamma-glutamyl-phosphate reductase
MYTYAIELSSTYNNSLITAALLGASGYSGAELLRLLQQRSDVKITGLIAASSAGKRVDEVYPAFSRLVQTAYEAYNPAKLSGTDVVFLALPSGEAMNIVPEIRQNVGHIIDLGGDFRLPSESLYQEYYRHEHSSPQLLSESVYGLPEIHFDDISKARLVANPGCHQFTFGCIRCRTQRVA